VQFVAACVGKSDGPLSWGACDPPGVDERAEKVGAETTGEVVALL
jgi:hypothetical protein